MNTYGPVVNSITFDLFETLMRDKKLRYEALAERGLKEYE
jgi:hypothetical protein